MELDKTIYCNKIKSVITLIYFIYVIIWVSKFNSNLPLNIENYEIYTIERKPTKQGPFSEDEIRDALSNLKENVQKLFGLTESEIQFVEGQFDHIQIQMYKEE